MRIGIEATSATRQYAGVGHFARGLLAGLAHIDAHNDYILLTSGKPRIAVAPSDVPPKSRWLRLPVSERLATIAWHRARLGPPVDLLTGRLSLFFTPDYALPPTLRAPGVLTVHDLSFLIHPECAAADLRRYLTSVVPRVLRRARAVVAVSETTATALRELLDVPKERIFVVPNGVDPRIHARQGDLTVAAQCLRAEFDLRPGYLLTVGTLEPRKNLVRLLQAYARFRARRQRGNVSGFGVASGYNAVPLLVVVGREGWLYEPIFHEVARLGLGDAVRFLTRVGSDAALARIYQGAGAFIFPSLYEGFGIPPLEAMAAGVPVATSTGGALPEVVGDAALLFDPLDVDGMASAMDRILEDTALRSHLIARGRARVHSFTWDDAATRLLSVFQAVSA